MMFCMADISTDTLSLTLAPKAESRRARFIYRAWASGRTGTSFELDMGVGVIGSKGDSNGV